jgi:hypothetical protein
MIDLILEHWDLAVAILGIILSVWLLYFSTWRNVGTDVS